MFLWTLVIAVAGQPTLAAERPDIVIYLSDDHSARDSSVYGNEKIPTPNLQRLAADGMTFTHAFVASPSCAPSRAAMLTGLMPARNGAEANHTLPRPDVRILTRDLQELGYEVAAFGKVSHNDYIRTFGLDHVGHFGGFAQTVDELRDEVAEYLASRDTSRPLCLFVGTTNPHVPWTYGTTFATSDVELPPHYPDTPATRAHRAAYYEEIKELDRLLGELRSLTAQHLGEDAFFLHTSDHGSQWPFGKWNLYDYGVRVPLVVAWPGQIRPGVRSDAMVSWVDLLPTVIDAVGGSAPEGLDGRSFLGVLEGEASEHRSRIFTTHSGDGRKNVYPIRSVRTAEWKLIHNLHPEYAHTNHSDLDRKPMAGGYWNSWAELAEHDERAGEVVDRYFRRPEWELYHVAEDDWEQTNLIDDPEHAELVAELKSELAEWRRTQGDTGAVFARPRPLADPKQWSLESFRKRTARK